MKNKMFFALLGIIAGSVTQFIYSDAAGASLEEIIEFVDDYIKNNGEKITEQHRLLQAILKGNLDDAKKAIKNGAKVNYQQDKKSPLFISEKTDDENNEIKAESFLLNYLSEGVRPLGLAAEYSGPAIVQYLLEVGANPNLSDNNGMTPLMVAANMYDEYTTFKEKTAIVKLLLKFEANPNMRNNFNYPSGYTALYYALFEPEKEDIVDALLEGGTNINLKYIDGYTLLHFTHDSLSPTKKLLALGADPNIQDDSGNRPLNIAIYKKNVELIELLLKYGANPSLLSTADRKKMGKLLLKSSNTKKQKFMK